VAIADQGPGDRIFKFARALKAFEATTGVSLPKAGLRSAFNIWWSIARSKIPQDAEHEEYLFLFLDAYNRVRAPLGANVLEMAARRMKCGARPPEANRYSSAKIVMLVHLCRELQLLACDSPFFLSTRDAGRLIGCPHAIAAALLNGLVRDGILDPVTKGSAQNRRASRFRFNFAVRSL
jgi:hypothetical protein